MMTTQALIAALKALPRLHSEWRTSISWAGGGADGQVFSSVDPERTVAVLDYIAVDALDALIARAEVDARDFDQIAHGGGGRGGAISVVVTGGGGDSSSSPSSGGISATPSQTHLLPVPPFPPPTGTMWVWDDTATPTTDLEREHHGSWVLRDR